MLCFFGNTAYYRVLIENFVFSLFLPCRDENFVNICNEEKEDFSVYSLFFARWLKSRFCCFCTRVTKLDA